MPIIEINLGPPSILPEMLPVQVGFGPVGPFGFGGIPLIPVDLGLGPFDFGLKVSYTCPGFPKCGKQEPACKFTKATPVYSFDPTKMLSFKIPGIPAFPAMIGPFGVSWQFPPRNFRPFNCPNYPNRDTRTP